MRDVYTARSRLRLPPRISSAPAPPSSSRRCPGRRRAARRCRPSPRSTSLPGSAGRARWRAVAGQRVVARATGHALDVGAHVVGARRRRGRAVVGDVVDRHRDGLGARARSWPVGRRARRRARRPRCRRRGGRSRCRRAGCRHRPRRTDRRCRLGAKQVGAVAPGQQVVGRRRDPRPIVAVAGAHDPTRVIPAAGQLAPFASDEQPPAPSRSVIGAVPASLTTNGRRPGLPRGRSLAGLRRAGQRGPPRRDRPGRSPGGREGREAEGARTRAGASREGSWSASLLRRID